MAAVAVRTERVWVEGAQFIKHNLTAKPPKQDASHTAALTSPRPIPRGEVGGNHDFQIP